MSKLKNRVIAVGALVGLALAMGLINSHRVQGEDIKAVKVVNPPSSPVATQAQGTTAVTGSVGIDPKSNTVALAPQSLIGIDPQRNTVTLRPGSTVCVAPECPVTVRQAATAVVFSLSDYEVIEGEQRFGPIDVSAYGKIKAVAQYGGDAPRAPVFLSIHLWRDGRRIAYLDTLAINEGGGDSRIIDLPGTIIEVVVVPGYPPPYQRLNLVIYGR